MVASIKTKINTSNYFHLISWGAFLDTECGGYDWLRQGNRLDLQRGGLQMGYVQTGG